MAPGPAARHLAALALLLFSLPQLAAGQGFAIPPQDPPPAFLIVEQERLLRESLYGRDVLAENESDAQDLRREGQALDTAFEAEERELTQQRPEMEPAAFRELADAFDAKVVATRRAQQERANQLALEAERRQVEFFRRVGPILLQLLNETGASAVVEERSVLIAKGDLNITDEVIKRLDAAYRAEAQDRPPGSEDPVPGPGETGGSTPDVPPGVAEEQEE